MNDYQYFSVVKRQRPKSRKTDIFDLVNKTSGATLGVIRWYAPWRQFCFMPYYTTVWSIGCIDDIRKAMGEISKARQIERDTEKGIE